MQKNYNRSSQTHLLDKPSSVDEIALQFGELGRHKRPSSNLWHLMLVAGDMLLVLTALLLASVLIAPLAGLFHIPYAHILNWRTKFIWMSLMFLSWNMVGAGIQIHDSALATQRYKSMLSVILTTSVTGMFLCIPLSSLFLRLSNVSSFLLPASYLAFAIPLLCLWRWLIASWMRKPTLRRKAVIVGVNAATRMLVEEIERTQHAELEILAAIYDENMAQEEFTVLPTYTGSDALRYFVAHNLADTLIMGLDYTEDSTLFQEAIRAAQQGITVVPLTTVYEDISGKVPVKHIGDQWYSTLPSEQVAPLLYLCWNRVIDLLFGLCGSLLLALLLPFLALLIRMDSRGPIFYYQERLGLQGKAFRVYKFRSMYTDAEQSGKPQWAQNRDPRITRIGRFMRSTHLDELPQVWNILRGDMSLIGPRPERAMFVSTLEQLIPFYRYRLSVKPGLTGWAQVKHIYTNTTDDALIKLQYDLYYIKHRSLLLDSLIILKTVSEVVGMRGV